MNRGLLIIILYFKFKFIVKKKKTNQKWKPCFSFQKQFEALFWKMLSALTEMLSTREAERENRDTQHLREGASHYTGLDT